jgi:hypothetical protein
MSRTCGILISSLTLGPSRDGGAGGAGGLAIVKSPVTVVALRLGQNGEEKQSTTAYEQQFVAPGVKLVLGCLTAASRAFL